MVLLDRMGASSGRAGPGDVSFTSMDENNRPRKLSDAFILFLCLIRLLATTSLNGNHGSIPIATKSPSPTSYLSIFPSSCSPYSTNRSYP